MNPIVIVGAGQAGATAATELRDRGHDGPIVVIGAEGHPPHERPPLSKGTSWVTTPSRPLRPRTAVVCRPRRRAAPRHDGDRCRPRWAPVVTATGRDFSYDRLLIATGSQPRRLAFADASGVPTAYLRTVEDSDRIRAAFGPGRRLVVIGAGWIGLEVAAAARAAGTEVVIFEAAELPLLRMLGPQVAGIFADLHRSHGVDLRLSALRGSGRPHRCRPRRCRRRRYPLGGAGRGGRARGRQRGPRRRHAAHRRPFVYAVGDVANHDHPVLRRRVRVEHWDTAIEQARSPPTTSSALTSAADSPTSSPTSTTSAWSTSGMPLRTPTPRSLSRATVLRIVAGLLGQRWRGRSRDARQRVGRDRRDPRADRPSADLEWGPGRHTAAFAEGERPADPAHRHTGSPAHRLTPLIRGVAEVEPESAEPPGLPPFAVPLAGAGTMAVESISRHCVTGFAVTYAPSASPA